MKTLLFVASIALTLSGFTQVAQAKSECRGLKSAHCFCKTVGYAHVVAKEAPPANVTGQEFFTFTVPGKCFNPQVDWLFGRINKGCWLECRNAFGVDGAVQSPVVIEMKKAAAAALAKQGVCGGYIQAELHFSAGGKKFRNATNMPVAFGAHAWKTVAGKKVCQ